MKRKDSPNPFRWRGYLVLGSLEVLRSCSRALPAIAFFDNRSLSEGGGEGWRSCCQEANLDSWFRADRCKLLSSGFRLPASGFGLSASVFFTYFAT